MSGPGDTVGPARLRVVDAEAGGDVGRVVLGGLAPPPGASVRARADWLAREADDLRRQLLAPPHGDPAHSINLVVPAAHRVAEAGFVTMVAAGYPGFSGSNAMCTAAVLVAEGVLPMPAQGHRAVVLEAPGGPATLSLTREAGTVTAVDYAAEPAFVARGGCRVEVAGHGKVAFDLVYGGNFHAVVDAAAAGLDPATADRDALARFGTALVEAARPEVVLEHPVHGDTGALSFVLVAGDVRDQANGPEIPVAVYVHPDVVRHGPTGTGTAALLASRAARGHAVAGTELVTVSPEGHRFRGRITRVTDTAVDTVVSGRPRILGAADIPIDRATVGPGLASLLEQ